MPTCTKVHCTALVSWSQSIKRAMDRVCTFQVVDGNIKHLLDMTLPNIIFIWSGKVILELGFSSPNIILSDQINMILVSVLSNNIVPAILLQNLALAACSTF